MRDAKTKKAWPTDKAMAQIYEQNLWGGKAGEFYSGEGSHHPKYLQPYLNNVTGFLKSFAEKPSVCDLGCGDFNVGKQLLESTSSYIAMDVVPELINRNRTLFKAEHLDFRCLDIANDDLPKTEVALIRNVLQHLSNAEVQAVVDKLSRFNYVILTEHLPEGEFTPNIDIISGQGIRVKKNSGVDITAPPFNFEFVRFKELLRIPFEEGKGEIVTSLLEV
jgi:hypothetical protein